MRRQMPGRRVVTLAAVVCTIGALGAPEALAQSVQYQSVRNLRGSITGVVSDDRGGPIAGAMVSALGTVMVAKAVTDASGWFSIDALPAGDYTLQAHRSGFVGSVRATVRVSGLSPALQRLQLRRLNSPVATTGTDSIAVLLAPDGTAVTGGDDEAGSFAAVSWNATSSGTYRLRVASFEAVETGTLKVTRD